MDALMPVCWKFCVQTYHFRNNNAPGIETERAIDILHIYLSRLFLLIITETFATLFWWNRKKQKHVSIWILTFRPSKELHALLGMLLFQQTMDFLLWRLSPVVKNEDVWEIVISNVLLATLISVRVLGWIASFQMAVPFQLRLFVGSIYSWRWVVAEIEHSICTLADESE